MVELQHDDKGCIAEAAFQYECLKRSITLFVPVKPTSRLDFIALRDDGSPVKIQVKWIWKKRGKKICDIRRRRLSAKGTRAYNYQPHEVDVFAFYDDETRDFFIIPFDEIGEQTHLTFSDTPNRNQYDTDWMVYKNKFEYLK